MMYKPAVVTQPLTWTEREEIMITTKGDSFFVSLTPDLDETLYTEDVPELPDRVNGIIWLDLLYKDVVDIITEGDSFTVKVSINKAYAVDMYVDFTISYDVEDAPTYIKESPESNDDERDVDYGELFFTSATIDDHDLVNSSYRLVIPAGSTSISKVVTTVDDDILTGYTGTYKVINITLSNLEYPDAYFIAPDNCKGSVLIEDSTSYPSWEGSLELWGKMHSLSSYEPLIDPDTSSTVSLNFGYDDEGSTLRTKIIDDVPIYSLQLRPDNTTLPTDIDEDDPIDISSILPYYRAVVQVGRRS